ncbi:MAG: hypothetical protein KBF68_03230, partial [Nitrosomonas sp.]|nr:hypothetical protein [Nitrosomonas sp.]
LDIDSAFISAAVKTAIIPRVFSRTKNFAYVFKFAANSGGRSFQVGSKQLAIGRFQNKTGFKQLIQNRWQHLLGIDCTDELRGMHFRAPQLT